VRRGTVALATVAVLAAGCSTPPPATGPGARVTALSGGRVLPSPQAEAIPDGVVLMEGATITAVGARETIRVPPGASVIGDPALDVRAFAKVRTTMRDGRIIYRRPP